MSPILCSTLAFAWPIAPSPTEGRTGHVDQRAEIRFFAEEMRLRLLKSLKEDRAFAIPHFQFKVWVRSFDQGSKQSIDVHIKEYKNDICVRVIRAKTGRIVFDDSMQLYLQLESVITIVDKDVPGPRMKESAEMIIRLSP